MKLNLGCGRDIRKGYVNIDFVKEKGVNVVADLNKKPYPFKDNSVDEIYASAILEHVDDVQLFMDECHRILKSNGKLEIIVPFYNCAMAFDLEHKHFFKHNWFMAYLPKEEDKLEMGFQRDLIKNKWELIFNELIPTRLGKIIPTNYLKFVFGVMIGEIIREVHTILQPIKNKS